MTEILGVRRGATLSKGFHTKESLARAACELLRRNGLHGTGLNELIAASGAPRGSLYYHFPGGKAEIVAAGLEIARAETCTLLRHAFSGKRPVHKKVEALFGQIARLLSTDISSPGCPVAAVAVDNFGRDDSLRNQCDSIFASWRDTIESGLPEIDDPARRAVMAGLILMAYEGALITARVTGNPAALLEAGKSLANTLCAEAKLRNCPA